MALNYDDIVAELNETDTLNVLLDLLKLVGIPVNAFQTGEAPLAILEVIARYATRFFNATVLPILKLPNLDKCSGDLLTVAAAIFYGVPRLEETFAEGPATVQNPTAGLVTLNEGDLQIRVVDVLGRARIYRNSNTTPITLDPYSGSGPYPEAEVPFRCEIAGSVGTMILIGSPLEVVSGQGVLVESDIAWVGTDQESDPDLRLRARASRAQNAWGGPRDIYNYILRTTSRPDGSVIPVTRVRVVPPTGDGTLTIYVATPSGALDSGDVTILQERLIDDVDPMTTTSILTNTTNVLIAPTLTVTVDRDADIPDAEIDSAIKTALANWLATSPIEGWRETLLGDGYVWKDELVAVASESHSAIVRVTTTFVDLLMASGEVPVAGTITITINQVKQS